MAEIKKKKTVYKVIVFVAIIICFLTFAITLTINFKPLFKLSLDHLQLEENSGLNKDIIYKNFKQLMSYLNSPFVNKLEMDDFPSSTDGAFHFYEVKKLFYLNYLLFIASTLTLIFAYFKWFKKRILNLKDFRKPLLITGLLPFLGLVFVFLDFSTVFLKFHELLFNNDKWVFNPQLDPIINVLPQEFFSYCFIFALVVFEILVVATAFYGFYKNNKDKRTIKVKNI